MVIPFSAKCAGGIDMRAVLPDHLVIGCAKSVFGDGVRLMGLWIGGTGDLARNPDHAGMSGPKLSVIDEPFRRDGLIGALKLCL